MGTAVVEVKPCIWAWLTRQYEYNQLNSKWRNRIKSWLDGERKPTFVQVESISHKLHIPLGYLFMDAPPVEKTPLLEYRTVQSYEFTQVSRDLLDTIDDMELVQDWLRNYLVDGGYDKFLYGGQVYKNSEQIVSDLRKDANLPLEWFRDGNNARENFNILRNIFSNLGVVIMMNGIVGNNTHRPLKVEEFRAFTLFDDYAPLVFINGTDSFNGRLFSLVHELAHVWCGKNNLFNVLPTSDFKISPLETICNKVAAEILVPDSLFVKQWKLVGGSHDVFDKVDLLTKYFNCGSLVIARRALDHKFITKENYLKVFNIICTQFNKNKKEASGGDFYNVISSRIDHRFFKFLNSSVQAGKTQYTDAFRLTGTNGATYAGLCKKLEGGGI